MLTKDELLMLLELYRLTDRKRQISAGEIPSCDVHGSIMAALEARGYVEFQAYSGKPRELLTLTAKGVEALKEALATAALTDGRSKRPEICRDAIQAALNQVDDALWHELDWIGYGSFSSTHEIDGVIKEEFNELSTAIRGNRPHKEIIKELIDIAVPAIFGIACIEEGAVDW